MLNAEEARKMTVEKIKEEISIKEIEESIAKAIDSGDFECKFEKRSLEEGLKEFLEDKGYTVDVDSRIRVVRVIWRPVPPPYCFD